MLSQLNQNIFRTFLALVAVCVVLTPALGDDRFADVEITATHVGGSVHMLEGAGGNLAISVGEDGVFLIDDQYAPLTERIIAAIAKISDRPVRFVLNTHWHGDHVGGNEKMGEMGSVIISHDNVRERMSTGIFDRFFDEQKDPSPDDALPLVTFKDTVTFHINGDEVVVLHVPAAHTDGDSVIFFRTANVVHTGDLYFNGLYPFIDYSVGGSLDGTIAALDLVAAEINDETIVIPGHGAVSNRAELLVYREMLQTVGDRIRKMIIEGKSLQEIQAAKPTAEYDESYVKHVWLEPDRWVAMLHASITESL